MTLYLYGAIQIGKADSTWSKIQIMIVSILKNKYRRYSNHYIVKFVSFMPIYYAINLDIVSCFMVFSNFYL